MKTLVFLTTILFSLNAFAFTSQTSRDIRSINTTTGTNLTVNNLKSLDEEDLKIYNNTTLLSNVILYGKTINTDANGRAVFYLTNTGAAGGSAIFNTVISMAPTVVYNPANTYDAPSVYIESISGNAITVRAVKGRRTSVFLGGNVDTFINIGSGVPLKLTVLGI